MLLPPNPRGMTGSGARSLTIVGCQPTMLEEPMQTTPPGAGVPAVLSLASKARIDFSKRAGSAYFLRPLASVPPSLLTAWIAPAAGEDGLSWAHAETEAHNPTAATSFVNRF